MEPTFLMKKKKEKEKKYRKGRKGSQLHVNAQASCADVYGTWHAFSRELVNAFALLTLSRNVPLTDDSRTESNQNKKDAPVPVLRNPSKEGVAAFGANTRTKRKVREG